MDFRQAWQVVEALQGQSFRLDPSKTFTYQFKRTYIVVEPGGQSIPRTHFEKVFRRPSGEGPPVQGQRFIRAIYDDPRFSEAGPAGE